MCPIRPHWQYRYDGDGRMVEQRDNFAQVSPTDIRIDHVNGVGDDTRSTTFVFDSAGQQRFRSLPNGLAEEAQFDPKGRMSVHIGFEGEVTRNVYDDTAPCAKTRSGR